jgi:4-hydroxybenzoate polyprenyltransferase
MYRQQVRLVVGLAVVLVHLFSFAVIMFFKTEWITESQRGDLALILLPVTATYFTAVAKSAVEQQSDFELGRRVNLNYVTIVFLVTGAFLLSVVFIVLTVPSSFVPTIDDAKKWLAALQVGLGAAFGYIATDLFGKIESVSVPSSEAPRE